MNDESKVLIKRISFILAVIVVLFIAADAYFLYFHGINIILITTQIIMGLVGAIIFCAILQRFFYYWLIKSNFFASYIKEKKSSSCQKPDKDTPSEETIKKECMEKKSLVTEIVLSIEAPTASIKYENSNNHIQENVSENQRTGSSYLKNLDIYKERIKQEEQARKILIMDAIHEYTNICMVKYLSNENLASLHENIDNLANNREDLYLPIRSNIDDPLTPTALKHYAWNIGERLHVSLLVRAKFIKAIFPYEMRNATIEYLVKNLKDYNSSTIPIDEPATGDYCFKCMINRVNSQNE